jgi:hypothetical protein
MEVGFHQVTDGERYRELRADLCTRTLCCGQALMELPSTLAFEALSDIGHNRYGSSLHLPCKAEVSCKGSLSSHLINCSGQLSGFLPGNLILKPI